MSVCNKKKQALQQSGVFYTSNKLLPEDCNINIKMQLFSIVSIQQSRVFFLLRTVQPKCLKRFRKTS